MRGSERPIELDLGVGRHITPFRAPEECGGRRTQSIHPNTGEVRSDGAEGIACWFIDTDYNEESFFVRHANFLGANEEWFAKGCCRPSGLSAGLGDRLSWGSRHQALCCRPF